MPVSVRSWLLTVMNVICTEVFHGRCRTIMPGKIPMHCQHKIRKSIRDCGMESRKIYNKRRRKMLRKWSREVTRHVSGGQNGPELQEHTVRCKNIAVGATKRHDSFAYTGIQQPLINARLYFPTNHTSPCHNSSSSSWLSTATSGALYRGDLLRDCFVFRAAVGVKMFESFGVSGLIGDGDCDRDGVSGGAGV
jgi:hypothetical protein